MLRQLASICTLAILTHAQFLYPTNNMVLRVGDLVTVRYHTTFEEYTIALWQLVPAGGGAIEGPLVYETTSGPAANFNWTVQYYDFDLVGSNQFFFWLAEGNADRQGDERNPRATSGYFNITDEPAPVEPSTTSTTRLPRTTSSEQRPSSTQPATTSEEPTTEASTVPTTTESSSAGATSSNAPGQGTGGDTDLNQEGSGQGSQSSSDGGLPTGALVGIGVGVGVVGISAIVGVFFWLRYLRKKQALLAESHQRDQQLRDWETSIHGSMAYKPQQQYQYQHPVEMEHSGYVNSRGPVEIS
ncbi:hypothetical protein S7711_07551 [Stachybotrys chartarum IBT 7711]|uniref:Mid2 domain-containing protein n=1 Tax=Stachybotrys chartarum (strain CBS 109288 / IBT 7711) TaxID=1280523 RepID=A0A084AN90_STACB|nr:hypothetical protein S7711_07551 [Stachybotrys chartarum IBT 7711]KFA74320.1 hypothetical protein S40288_03701 [Stachybotrys chartarum IBT 40288]